MNKTRFNELLEAIDSLDDAVSTIQEVIDEEQDAFDNLPPGLQDSERGAKMEDAINFMEGLISEIENIELKIKGFK